MTRARLILGPLAGALLLAACHRKAEDPTIVTADEQRQLNEAAASLDASANTVNDVDAPAGGNTEDTT